MAFLCLRIPPLFHRLRCRLHGPMLAYSCLRDPLTLLASLAAPQFSAASGGAPLAFAHSTLSPSYLRDPRLAPQSSAFPFIAGWSSTGLQSQL